jgi:signal peptidase I
MHRRFLVRAAIRSVIICALSLLFAIVLFHFIFQPFQVSGLSMAPTLQNRDYILIDRVFFRDGAIQRGDLVVFRLKSRGRFIVKRVVGLPGEKLQIRQGHLYIDGKHISSLDEKMSSRSNFGPVVVPRGTYFCLGDNRAVSLDSRQFGPVKASSIYGIVLLRYLPLGQGSLLERPIDAK